MCLASRNEREPEFLTLAWQEWAASRRWRETTAIPEGFFDGNPRPGRLRYHIAVYLPKAPGEMVVAEALDLSGAVSQGFALADAGLMIASALGELAQLLLEEGSPLPQPSQEVHWPEADLIELMPVSIYPGTPSR